MHQWNPSFHAYKFKNINLVSVFISVNIKNHFIHMIKTVSLLTKQRQHMSKKTIWYEKWPIRIYSNFSAFSLFRFSIYSIYKIINLEFQTFSVFIYSYLIWIMRYIIIFNALRPPLSSRVFQWYGTMDLSV